VIVTAAIIRKGNKVLIAKRGDKWEFPGGKLEENESMEECIKREIKEELGIEISVIKKFCIEKKDEIELHVFTANYEKGNIKLNFHNDAKWIGIEELNNYDFLPLDKRIVKKIQSHLI